MCAEDAYARNGLDDTTLPWKEDRERWSLEFDMPLTCRLVSDDHYTREVDDSLATVLND